MDGNGENGDLRSDRTLLQHGFADELMAGINYGLLDPAIC
jgi:hypothetical protein